MKNQSSKPCVYHFDKTEKFYLGQEEARLDPLEGRPMVPGSATLIAPPKQWPEGQIPVFDGKAWSITVDSFWRPRYKEVNYDAGRLQETWRPKTISHTDFPIYPDLHRLTNSSLVVSQLVEKIQHIEFKFQQLNNSYLSSQKQGATTFEGSQSANLNRTLSQHFTYKFETEELIFHMRYCLDTLCRLSELLVDVDQTYNKKEFQFDSVRDVLDERKNGQTKDIMKGNSLNFDDDKTDFLKISNSLFNAMKHSHVNAESQMLLGVDGPTIVAFHAPPGKHQHEIIYHHNHNAYHLMMGFHDTIDRVLHNQRIFIASQ